MALETIFLFKEKVLQVFWIHTCKKSAICLFICVTYYTLCHTQDVSAKNLDSNGSTNSEWFIEKYSYALIIICYIHWLNFA